MWCLFRHKWSKWIYGIENIYATGIYKLTRKCERCGKISTYTGPIIVDIITGERAPLIIKK